MQINYKLIRCLLGVVCVGVLSVPAQSWADKTVTMVTYFPVPYAKYDNIYVTKKLDVGTQPGTFVLNLGTDSLTHPAMTVDKLKLFKKSDDATKPTELTLDADIKMQSASFGDVEGDPGAIEVGGTHLRVGSINTDTGGAVADINVVQNLAVGELFLFPDVAVSSANVMNVGNCSTTAWQEINIGNGTKKYLLCCDGKEECGTKCYYADDTLKNQCIGSDARIRGALWKDSTNWNTDNYEDLECGCNCPDHSHVDENGVCQPDTGYIVDDNGDVQKGCDVDSYRAENLAECCPEPEWRFYFGDPVCFDLHLEFVKDEFFIESDKGEGTCPEGSWTSMPKDPEKPNLAGESCHAPDQTTIRSRAAGVCERDATKCCREQETYSCVNSRIWE